MASNTALLRGEAESNLDVLNGIKNALQLSTLQEIPAKLEEVTLNDEFLKSVSSVAQWVTMSFLADLEEACGRNIVVHENQHKLDSFTVERVNYLNEAKAFEEAAKAYAFGESKEEFTGKVASFVKTTEDFAGVLDAAITEVSNEIAEFDIQAQNTTNAIAGFRKTIADESENMNTAFTVVEMNLDLAKDAETSGAHSYVEEIISAITSMKVSKSNAQKALEGLKNVTDDANVIETSEDLIRQMDGLIADAEEMKNEATQAAVNAAQAENQEILCSVEETHKDIADRVGDIQNYLDDTGQLLTDAQKIIAEEHLLMPTQIEIIKNARRTIEKALAKVTAFETDAKKILDSSNADRKNANQYLKKVQAVSKKSEEQFAGVTAAYADAKSAMKKIRFYVNMPQSLSEAFAYVAVVPVKQFRKYNTTTKFYRSLFGLAMLVSFLIGAINWSMAFHDLYHSVGAGITAGVVWFFVMYTIDRIFVMSMDKQAAKRLGKDMTGWSTKDKILDYIYSGELVFMGMRLVIIYFSSLIVAELMTANIYDREIKEELVVMRAERVQDVNKIRTARIAELTSQQDLAQQAVLPFIAKFKAAAQPLEKVVDEQRAIVKDRNQDYQDEYNGISRSGQPRGDGRLSKLKKSVLDKEEATLKVMEEELKAKEAQLPEYAALATEQKKAEAEIARLNVLIKDETARFDGQASLVQKSSGDGLDYRMTALHRVSKNSPWPNRFMVVLFIIEAITLIGKMLLGADEHVSTVKSLNEASEEALRVKDLERQAANATAMNTHRAIIVNMRQNELTQTETLLQAQRNHENKILHELTVPQDLVEKNRLLSIKEGLMKEFVAKQKSIRDSFNELSATDDVVNKKNKKDKAA